MVRIALKIAPKHLHSRRAAVAYVIGNVDIKAGQIGVGVEEVQEILASQHCRQRAGFAGRRQVLRLRACDFFELGTCSIQRLNAVRQQQRFVGFNVNPEDLRAIFVVLAITVAASEALHQRRPRRKLGEHHLGRNINASFDRLSCYDDAIFVGFIAQLASLFSSLGWAEARVHQKITSAQTRFAQ